jgi:hypothetical protein
MAGEMRYLAAYLTPLLGQGTAATTKRPPRAVAAKLRIADSRLPPYKGERGLSASPAGGSSAADADL